MNDKKCIIFFSGLILLQYIVKILKKYIKQSRPMKSNTNGMPSTKSATISYISTFLILHYNLNNETKLKLIILTIIGFLYKLYYKEHTKMQILCGIIIGIIYAYLVELYIKNI